MTRLASELAVAAVLGDGGALGEFVAGFEPRASQLGMAELIAEAIALGESRVIEASTGIGKSFAYLVPALLTDARVVISTGTRNLQDQLYHKDIPLVRQAVVAAKRVALLKGRGNYCCRYRLGRFRNEERFRRRETASIFAALEAWAAVSDSGDIAEFADLPENDSLWYYATSNTDNCLGGECPEIDRCFVLRARKRALEADLLVINHHLFFSDLALKAEGFGEILPRADVLIFDEAHQLPEIASRFYGQQVTLRQIEILGRDLVEAELTEAGESRVLARASDVLLKAAADLRLALRDLPEQGEWERVRHAPGVESAVAELGAAIAELEDGLDGLAGRGRELAQCLRRVQALGQALEAFLAPADDLVSWYECRERGLRLALSPLDVAPAFRAQLEQTEIESVFFTSATLSSQQSFRYYCARLGIEDIECARFDSPFDYERQALLYLPTHLPDPADAAYPERFGELCRELIDATGGYSFILFTSHRMLRLTAEYLRARIDNPLMVQGEAQRSELLRRFVDARNPVLLGTSSFWEGVDVKGDQLRCVIIDKLPFKSPHDPVYRQRLQRVNEQGGNAFVDVQVPEATISLRQGVGRLIRDAGDRGIVVLCDNRLHTRGYGKGMLASLPPMRRTSEIDEVRAFARELDGAA